MELGDDKAPFDPDNMADLQIRVVGLINNAYTNLFDQSIGGTYRKIWLEWFRACGENIKCQPEKEIFQHYKGMYDYILEGKGYLQELIDIRGW